MISITATMLLTLVLYSSGPNDSIISQNYSNQNQGSKMTETQYYSQYDQLNADEKTVVIFPIFTQSAYEWSGIHDFYLGRCDDCLSVTIQNFYDKRYATGGNGYSALEFLGYKVIDDVDVDKNPKILEDFDKVILLHNEFATKNIFDAVTNHENVIYLYPNSLTSQVVADYSENTITLIRGPNYPEPGIANGFDWENDNSQYFSDWDCENWQFFKVGNGHMLNCYPEKMLKNDGFELLKKIKNL